MSLEHVAQGQTRLQTPGLAPDPRGIALGRFCLLNFSTLEGVVSWLRLYAAEASLDELLSGLEIFRVRSPLQSREMMIQIPAVSSYACDRAARLVRLLGGATYTGSARHFVKYRDDRSPYGYDVVDVSPLPAGFDLVVHGEDFTQAYAREAEISLATLLQRLSIRRVPRTSREELVRSELMAAVPHGLSGGVIRYLWRNRVAGEAAMVTPTGTSAFADDKSNGSYLLLRLVDVPPRIVTLLVDVPGIAVFRPISENIAVALDYAHPIDLSSCASVFPVDKIYLFWPSDRIDVLSGPAEYSNLANLTHINVDADEDGVPDAEQLAASATSRRLRAHDLGAADAIAVTLRLEASAGLRGRIVATLIPLEHADRLRRVVFALPPAVLRAYRVAVTASGILVVATGDVDLIPLGDFLVEQAPGILVPLGLELQPRVSPEVLAKALGHDAGVWTVFDRAGVPMRLGDAELTLLERRAILPMSVDNAVVEPATHVELGTPNLVNDSVGRFSLWGIADPERDNDGKLLPP